MNIVFIADYFVEEVLGGGELNNEELMSILHHGGHIVEKIKSTQINHHHIKEKHDSKFIIANFLGLSQECKRALANKDYVIYEHDHKYLKSRNPADYDLFMAPEKEIINYEFYKNAHKVLCQTKFHANIVRGNLKKLDNIESLGGNIWNLDSLAILEQISNQEKLDRCAIMDSPIPHKNTAGAIKFCKAKKHDYKLILGCPYYDFLKAIGENDKFVFFPRTPETLSRIVVEARMMGMKVITNNLIGATSEPWFKLKGIDLVQEMRNKRNQISDRIIEIFNESKS
jgi:hypothetical protein